jgi:hypothetical protein
LHGKEIRPQEENEEEKGEPTGKSLLFYMDTRERELDAFKLLFLFFLKENLKQKASRRSESPPSHTRHTSAKW